MRDYSYVLRHPAQVYRQKDLLELLVYDGCIDELETYVHKYVLFVAECAIDRVIRHDGGDSLEVQCARLVFDYRQCQSALLQACASTEAADRRLPQRTLQAESGLLVGKNKI